MIRSSSSTSSRARPPAVCIYDPVDPDNRLVARTLERDWNDKLAAIADLERESSALPRLTARLVSSEERQRIVALAQDIPAVWHAATTTPAERKQLLRFLVKD